LVVIGKIDGRSKSAAAQSMSDFEKIGQTNPGHRDLLAGQSSLGIRTPPVRGRDDQPLGETLFARGSD
jgi:hypothetical protein